MARILVAFSLQRVIVRSFISGKLAFVYSILKRRVLIIMHPRLTSRNWRFHLMSFLKHFRHMACPRINFYCLSFLPFQIYLHSMGCELKIFRI